MALLGAAMKKLLRAVAFGCFLSWVGATAAETQNEGLKITLGPEWKAAFTPRTRKLSFLEFFRGGDDIKKSQEMLSIDNAGAERSSKFSLKKMRDAEKAYMDRVCPGAITDWNVIEESGSSILSGWQAKPCLGQPEQHEIERVIAGTHNLFFLVYHARGHELASDTRAQVIKTLSAATVDTGGSALVPSAWSAIVDEVIPFEIDKALAAVKPAMEIKNCHVTEATANRVECKRPRATSEGGGESVTAVLEAQGSQTRVQISTGKGFFGRLAKENWSNRVYEEMVRILQEAEP
jgi:hypothetical protein